MNEPTWIAFDIIERFMKEAFIKAGVPANDAAVCANVLITADKRGIDSHGIGRFKPIYIDRILAGIQKPVTTFEVLREGPTTALVDGHDGMGHVIAKQSMEMAIHKAHQYGLGMVAVRNSTHYGIAGYYAIMAAEANMIGITGTNARPSQAPTFGVENMLGTNPLTIGFPTDEAFPFVIDCATSTTQRGKIEHYCRIGKAMPAGWVIDNDGRAVTDPALALEGLCNGTMALMPLGGIGEEMAGYKGYGYAVAVEVLSSALQTGACLKALSGLDECGKRVPHRLGHFFIAIAIDAFTDPASFKKNSGDILRALRASKKAKDAERIYTAGEKEYLAWLDRKNKGVPLNAGVRKDMLETRDILDMEFTFPFEDKEC